MVAGCATCLTASDRGTGLSLGGLLGLALLAACGTPHLAVGKPVIVPGDTKPLPSGAACACCWRWLAALCDTTVHFNRGLRILGRIDRVAHDPQVRTLTGPRTLRRRVNDDWPSDHCPVVAERVSP
ncbi:hypothetical protein [Maliponia aquimaris]|uniref:Uncharacterized protein n=1 Tax=Maliponia aquimaris TaxID=1673631 RepID=A0A238L0M5_9RHOB|nr:hypothetical protein [Maliponia aquimaris]SMX48644.1 hypothetical protein MAA8898_04028 [Maliponia aquimaris]